MKIKKNYSLKLSSAIIKAIDETSSTEKKKKNPLDRSNKKKKLKSKSNELTHQDVRR